MSNTHPITLQQVFFVRSVVVANTAHTPSETEVTLAPVNSLDVRKMPDQERIYQAHMRCTINAENEPSQPYVIDMECVGNFEVDGKLSPEEAERGVLITANSVLYGAIREAVSWLTGRQPFGALTLGLSVLATSSKLEIES
ncbi:protein-export chaperone SecB [Limnohabitans sp.]|uniref:protein-export chaperone SecB n=1 Tax=Limnohabitans sp. TaxID=1907725 RepID=UPI00286F6B2A|nr:protein-export chaperone SecB [Limnohabitans sp.]